MQTAIAEGGDATGGPTAPAPRRALASWVMFDWAVQPFYTLIVTFLFAPYFATVVVGDSARGQQLWGYAAASAGILVAVGSPFLGALADGRGARKPWVALFAILLAVAMSLLWLAVPAAGTGTILLVLTAFVIATAAAEFATVFTNAIMPTLVPHDQLGRLSGTGWAVGYAGGLLSLVLVAGLLVAMPGTGKTLMGFEPLLKLDAARHESDRMVAPLAAAWFLMFVLPFFLFVPDRAAPAPERGAAPRRSAVAELRATIGELPQHRSLMRFLIARMLYSDGLSAIFAFGGIYGAAVFGWTALELAVFGILVIVTGIAGAYFGGIADDRIGSKRVILLSLVVLIAGSIGILSVDKTHILFGVDVAPKAPQSAPFSSWGERAFLAFAILVGIVAAPVQAASRALLARLAPKDKMTQYFGLFAFSGKVTAFAAPLLVAAVTQATGSQRIGMAAILVFLVAGIVLMLGVRDQR